MYDPERNKSKQVKYEGKIEKLNRKVEKKIFCSFDSNKTKYEYLSHKRTIINMTT